MCKLISKIFFLLCLVGVCQNAFAKDVPALIETQWLADNLKKRDIRLVLVGDISRDDKTVFPPNHIPGSVHLGIKNLRDVLGDGSKPPDKIKFEALMSKLGVSNTTHVVVYGMDGRNTFVDSVFWLMKFNGHKKVSYLNGGLMEWIKERRQTTKENTAINPSSPPLTKGGKGGFIDESIWANADYVLQNLKNPAVVIVDTRNLNEYKGTAKSKLKRKGHIPDAVHVDSNSANLNDDGTFKSVKELKAVYGAKGITKDKEIITYCQGGIRAAQTYFVLRHLLGYPKVRVYVGSWREWSRLNPARYPVER